MGSVITESDMDFVADNTFYIEKSALYTSLGEGVKTVEYLRVKDGKLLFVEARKTFPNPDNPDAENLSRFREQIDEICEKFIHSLNLLSSVEVGVADWVYPDDFTLPDNLSLAFVFVIRNHETKWCKRIRQKFIEALPMYLKRTWNPEVFVINHETAMKHNLAVS